MPVRTCKVTFRDAQGIEHCVRVSAQSLYEAVAQALRVFMKTIGREFPNTGPPPSW